MKNWPELASRVAELNQNPPEKSPGISGLISPCLPYQSKFSSFSSNFAHSTSQRWKSHDCFANFLPKKEGINSNVQWRVKICPPGLGGACFWSSIFAGSVINVAGNGVNRARNHALMGAISTAQIPRTQTKWVLQTGPNTDWSTWFKAKSTSITNFLLNAHFITSAVTVFFTFSIFFFFHS